MTNPTNPQELSTSVSQRTIVLPALASIYDAFDVNVEAANNAMGVNFQDIFPDNASDLRFYDDKGMFYRIELERVGDENDASYVPPVPRKELMRRAFTHITLNFGVYPTVVTNYEEIAVIDMKWFLENGCRVSHKWYNFPFKQFVVNCSEPEKLAYEEFEYPPQTEVRPRIDRNHPNYAKEHSARVKPDADTDLKSYIDCHDRIHSEMLAIGYRPVLLGTGLEGLWFGYTKPYWHDPVELVHGREVKSWSSEALGTNPTTLSIYGPKDADMAGQKVRDASDQTRMGYRNSQRQFLTYPVRLMPVPESAARLFNNAHPHQ